MHIAALALILAAGIAVHRAALTTAGVLLVAAPVLGASAIILLAREEGAANGLFIGYSTFAFTPILAALVLPRGAIIPASCISSIFYMLSQFVVPVNNFELPGIDAVSMSVSVLILLVFEGLFLHYLRVEFDSRFAVLTEALKQTELAKEEAELARLRAEKADKTKSQFLANMSHELRTPLNAIIGYDEAMLAGMAGTFTDKQTDLLKQIQRNGRRLLNLINDVLDLAKVESGTLKANYAPIEPRLIIPEIIASVKSLADDRRLPIEVDIVNDLPDYIVSDAPKLEQILVNLLSNAIKFTDHGSICIAVKLEEDNFWSIQVRDTGMGIPEDLLPYVFEPFRQADGSVTRKHKGTGLGLAITRRLVECIEGDITVVSRVGTGTQFTVRLPLSPIAHRTTTQTMKSVHPEVA